VHKPAQIQTLELAGQIRVTKLQGKQAHIQSIPARSPWFPVNKRLSTRVYSIIDETFRNDWRYLNEKRPSCYMFQALRLTRISIDFDHLQVFYVISCQPFLPPVYCKGNIFLSNCR
jgi:hypothetical protein